MASLEFETAKVYASEVADMAKEEGIDININQLAAIFQKTPIDDIERVINAMQRFGVQNIIDAAQLHEKASM